MTGVNYDPVAVGAERPHASEDVRAVTRDGRTGWVCTSRHGRITLPEHPLSGVRGHLSLWFLPLEELSQHPMLWHTFRSNGVGTVVPLVTDHPDGPEIEPARFGVVWQPHWGHPMVAKFASGTLFPGMCHPARRHYIEASCDTFRRGHWYRMDLAFDHEKGEHTLWINGTVVGRSNRYPRTEGSYEPCGPALYLRGPQVAYGAAELQDEPIDGEAVKAAYAAEAPESNRELDAELRAAMTGAGNRRLELQPKESDWRTELDLDLCDPGQARHFYVQGDGESCHWEPDGLRIATRQSEPFSQRDEDPGDDRQQMYLWSRQCFRGDLYVRYDFQPLQHGGLALFIANASGMQGEDFMADYPLRTDGAMKTIHSSDVRMYHWEFYREMNDTRNDVPTHALVKWPWEQVLAAGIGSDPIRYDAWNRFEYRQTGSGILGTINGEVVIDGNDLPYAGRGPVLRHGHIALRCMIRTEIRFRNLLVQCRDTLPLGALPGNDS